MKTRRSLTAISAILCWVVMSAGTVSAGSIVSWGSNADGLVDQTPVEDDFVAVAAGNSHSLALRANGTVVAWGLDADNRLDVPDSNDIVAIDAGYEFSLALKKDGSIVAWGRDNFGQVGDAPTGNDFIAIAAGGEHGVALKEDGSLVHWGRNFTGQAAPLGNDFFGVAGGGFHRLALRGDGITGSVTSWGNSFWDVEPVAGGSDFIAVDGGHAHSLALGADGTLAAWGGGGGTGVGQVADTPQDGGYVAIAAGNYFNVALKDDGSIVGWGENGDDQTTVPEGNDYVAIAAGEGHALAISEPGTLALTSPNGGEVLKTGTIQTITWETEGNIANVRIEYSTDSGNEWIGVSPANKGNTGSYEWLVPIATSQECLVRVRPATTTTGADVSDAVLAIYTCTLAGDVTGDCVVDFADLAVIAADWLKCAYPFVSEPVYPGDVNGDNSVDAADLMVLSNYWLDSTCRACDWCGGADIDKSGSVNIADLAELAGHWMMEAEG